MASKVLGFGATTLHHWSGIGDGRLSHFQPEAKFLKDDRFAAAKSRIENAEVLVIDEIGMLSETIFNKIEHICRLARGNNLVFWWSPGNYSDYQILSSVWILGEN